MFFALIQSEVQTGRAVHQIPCKAPMNSVEWNPKYNLLAYAGDDKNKYQADEGAAVLLISCSGYKKCRSCAMRPPPF